MFRRTSRIGFTLIELLVVIGIISLLIGILLPALSKARKSAQAVICMSNMRQWGLGIQMYANQNRGWLPQKGPDGSNQGSNNFGPPNKDVIGYDDPGIWFNAIPPLLNDKSYYDMLVEDYNKIREAPHPDGYKSIFICPAAGASATQNKDIVSAEYFLLFGVDSQGAILNSTGHASLGQFKFASSYVWNSKLGSTIGGGAEQFVKISQASPASEVVLMTEKLSYPGEYTEKSVQAYANDPKVSVLYGGKINSQGYNNNIGQTKADFRRFTTRHRAGGHLLFADAHVGWFAWTEVQPPPDQLPFADATSDANNYGKVRWSALGPVN